MDRSYGEGRYTFEPIDETLQGRPSIESATTSRLQKKRSVRRVRSDADRLNTLQTEGSQHQRKSSIRDAFRKIFSRRSKIAEPAHRHALSVQTTPSKYYNPHNSQSSPAPRISPQATSDRAISAPLRSNATTPVELPRLRSPNALEFPKSRHLKPLTLPSPFDDPRSTLRRRKTLPSILIAPEDAKAIAEVIRNSSIDASAALPATSSRLAVQTSKQAKRRSRSAGDLRDALMAGPQRKRSDEIRFWRESIQTAILTNSGYVVDPEVIIEAQEVITPPRRSINDAQRTSVLQTSPVYDLGSSAYGTEFSRDLEDRIAKLEANLQAFQQSLNRIQSNHATRRAEIEATGRAPRSRRDSADHRTPSMLAEDLRQPLAPSEYQYGFEPHDRPQTAPTRPVRPPRPDEPVPALPVRQPIEEPRVQSPSVRPRRPSRPDDPVSLPVQDDTYTSLYQMLNDERTARHRLELQLNDMRNEISDLQQQVSAHSQIQSQRSSYLYMASDVTAGSSRLRELLVEAEANTRPNLSPQTTIHPSNRVTSRFSASTRQESEAGQTQASSEDMLEPDMHSDRMPRIPSRLQLAQMGEEPSTTAGSAQPDHDFKTPTQAGGFSLTPRLKPQDGGMF